MIELSTYPRTGVRNLARNTRHQRHRWWMLATPLAALLCCALGESALGAAPGEPIATRQNVFAIPFQVSPARTPAEAPKGVQLYVSEDHGANWRLEKQLEPSAGRFPFRASRDGEYWFHVRTIDANGRILPEGPQQPGLKVLVDTVGPTVELAAVEDKASEVGLQWRASDAALDGATLKIESQLAPPAGPWYPVPVNEADVQRASQNNTGRARFRLPEGAGEIIVRIEISDRAGNRATSQATVRMASRANPGAGAMAPQPPMAGSLGTPPTTTPPNVTAAPPSEPGVKPWPADQVTQRPMTSGAGTPGGATQVATGPALQPPLVPLAPAPIPPAQPAAMSRNNAAAPPLDALPRSASEGFPSSAGTPTRNANEVSPPGNIMPPPLVPLGSVTGNPPTGNATIGTPPPRTSLIPDNLGPLTPGAGNPPAVGRATAAPVANDIVPRSLFDPSLLPAGVTPQQVNVLKFQVDYGVESVGPAAVGRVELWGTRDGGRTWQSFGLDSDNKSPLAAVVPGNGLYGFRIVVSDVNGRGEPAPRNGDAPQVWIAVDASPPDVRISPPVPRRDVLPIIFSVADEQLDPQSVALFYSHRADGAWNPITQGLGNTTRYDWAPPPGITGPVFLRIEARDRGGNIGAAVTREPILLDRPVPKSTINGVRVQ